ncbi:cysteine and histidine-rich domain-containing protein morgana [Condylostylus longicornis]|uniref:cysteine and histidine-rich domain-containing protein morgana n=1 Tax=Condylostylus longicornis TaxID=2530218 RepID=UPI00244DC842|nr:cysteine and histidine-rich domain-containing protein morgana [Condylostylus longicornis]
MLQCYNRGCGKKFNADENTDESCCHHPGEPFFHDVYKGWLCCNKKTIDFTEFLNIKGCTLSKHSNIKPPEPVKEEKNIEIVTEVPKVERLPIKSTMERPPFNETLTKVHPVVLPALKEAIDSLIPKLKESSLSNRVETDIKIGTSCKRSGCTAVYSTETIDSECQYHSGYPVFHEGMKYWTCCQKKTSDFTAFMNQKGCSYSKHKWFSDDQNSEVVNCRYDWHQTGKDVIVAIYAKLYHYENSSIEINPIRLKVSLCFPEQNNAKFELDLELRGIIDVKKTTAKMYGTKVEIIMPKAEPGSWAKLDFPRSKQVSETVQNDVDNKGKQSDSENSDVDLDDLDPVGMGPKILNLS